MIPLWLDSSVVVCDVLSPTSDILDSRSVLAKVATTTSRFSASCTVTDSIRHRRLEALATWSS
jgi:hypothetical protein